MRTLTFILIEAEEGYTGTVYVAAGEDLTPLCALITQSTEARAVTGHPEDVDYSWTETQALLTALQAQTGYAPGRYPLLTRGAPLYDHWTLVIVDGPEAFLGY